jgi:hypothetical protein
VSPLGPGQQPDYSPGVDVFGLLADFGFGQFDWQDIVRALIGSGDIPLAIKIGYSLFICVLVPIYWRYYGPANFLWFSDIALFVILLGLWLESPLLISMQAVSVMILDGVWLFDFLARLIFRVEITGVSKYMFNRELPRFVRALSLFHIWLPPLLLWLVYQLGYDRRAWLAQSLLAWVVLLVCYCFTKRSDNINWVFGLWSKAQTRLPSLLYLFLLMVGFSVCMYLPIHLLLLTLMPAR